MYLVVNCAFAAFIFVTHKCELWRHFVFTPHILFGVVLTVACAVRLRRYGYESLAGAIAISWIVVGAILLGHILTFGKYCMGAF